MTVDQLLALPWYRVPAEEQEPACRHALKRGKEVIAMGLKQVSNGGMLWSPEPELYVNWGLCIAAPQVRREWLSLGVERINADPRVKHFLDVYGRLWRRHRGEEIPSFEEGDYPPLLTAKQSFRDEVLAQVRDLQQESLQLHRDKRWDRYTSCEKVLQGLYGVSAELHRDVRLLEAHLYVIRHSPDLIPEVIETCYWGRKEVKELQEEALALVECALLSPRPKSVCAAVWQALEAGISPRDHRLRDQLLAFQEWLEDDARLQELALSVQNEIERRETVQPAAGRRERPQKMPHLDGEIDRLLGEVLPLIRGKTAVMIGGTCRPEVRDVIGRTLELRDLQWPTTTEQTRFVETERYVRKADICYLNQFNRSDTKAAYRVCREHQTALIRLGTYGLNHIIYRSWDQLCNRQGGFTTILQRPV